MPSEGPKGERFTPPPLKSFIRSLVRGRGQERQNSRLSPRRKKEKHVSKCSFISPEGSAKDIHVCEVSFARIYNMSGFAFGGGGDKSLDFELV